MNSCSSILVLLAVATINTSTSAFVLPKHSISPSLIRTKVASEPTLLNESTEVDEPTTGSTVEEDIVPSVEENVDPRARLEPGRHDNIDYSIAFPSLLKRPRNLDGSHAGDYGFDPLNLSEEYDLYYMQECEIRHARLAMLAVVGWPMSELIAPNWMLRDGCAPSVLNGFNPLTFLVTVAAFGAFGFLEYSTSLRRTKGTKLGDTHLKDMELIWKYGVAGDYNWDPLNLYSSLGDDAAGRKGLRTLEITQGRYAMLGITYFVLWEALTHSPIVKNSIFFHPNLALPFLAVAYFAWSQIFQFRPISEMVSNERIEIEYTKDGEQMLEDWARLTKGPRSDLAIKVKEATGGIEMPKELGETVSQFGATLESLMEDLKKDGKVTTTNIAGGVAGLTFLIATILSPSGGDNNKPTPRADMKVVKTTVTTPKKSSPVNIGAPEMPKFTAPELPKFTAPEVPKFTAPEVPKFTAPEVPKFASPDVSSSPNKNENSNKLTVPKSNAPELSLPSKTTAPETPKFKAPDFSVPKFTAPEISPPKPDEKKAADPVIVEEKKTKDVNAVKKATPSPPSPDTVVKKDSKAALEESRKAAQERRERAAEDYAKRRAESKAALEASRKAAQERREQAAEDYAKRKADTQSNFNKRSYFGDATVMGDDVQGGKLLPKEEVSSEVKEILKLYTK